TTGFPLRSGLFLISTAAKKQSISICNIFRVHIKAGPDYRTNVLLSKQKRESLKSLPLLRTPFVNVSKRPSLCFYHGPKLIGFSHRSQLRSEFCQLRNHCLVSNVSGRLHPGLYFCVYGQRAV